MEQYIKKSALVAEIDRRLEELYSLLPDASKVENGTITVSEACNTGKYTALESFRKYINTLEVKEVNLEKEIKDYFDSQPIITKSKGTYYKLISTGVDIAKHFYELGLKAQKGEKI